MRVEVEMIQRDKPLFENLFEILLRSSLSCNPKKTQNKLYLLLGSDNGRLMKQNNKYYTQDMVHVQQILNSFDSIYKVNCLISLNASVSSNSI
jgi:hypothetical protein